MINKNLEKLNYMYKKYKLSLCEINQLNKIILPIINHPKIKKRMTSKFSHHGKITVGEHIIEDAIVSYKIGLKSKKKIDIKLVVIIAMLHDLYTNPYQNAEKIKEKSFFNKHGFRHPIEAVINSMIWYPELFKNTYEAKIITDGIVHHMYPLPVQYFYESDDNILDLNNFELVKNIPQKLVDILVESTNKGRYGKISIIKSKYDEGKIVSKADKIVTMKQIKNFRSLLALLTGKNKDLL